MIFVRIDNISNRMYTGVFKICAKGFWFSATALFNNIYVITIKQSSQFFFIGDNSVFMSNCLSVISLFTMKPFFVRNGFMNFEKLLLVVKPFSVSFLRYFFMHFLLKDTQKFLCFLCAILFFFEGFLCILFFNLARV